MRKELYDNIPLIVDIVDKLDVFYAMYNKRKKIYQENKYKIKIINNFNNNEEVEEEVVEELKEELVEDDDEEKEEINYKKKYMFNN
jgi:hypothetical protein